MRTTVFLVLVGVVGCGSESSFPDDESGESESEAEEDIDDTTDDSTDDDSNRCRSGARCEFDSECCAAHFCDGGECQRRPTPDCKEDADCDDDETCDDGECVEILCAPASIEGPWLIDGQIDLGEDVNPVTQATLDLIYEMEEVLCTGLPTDEWYCGLLDAATDVGDMLDTMQVEQEIELTATDGEHYTGTEVWTDVAFEVDGEWLSGEPEDVYDWEITIDPFTAYTECDEELFAIDQHHVTMNFCNVTEWALTTLLSAASGGSLNSLAAIGEEACSFIGDDLIEIACAEMVETVLEEAIPCGDVSLLGFTYGGEASIQTRDTLDDGEWTGTLDLGGEVAGTFDGERD